MTISGKEDRALVTVTLQRKLKRRGLELCAELACRRIMWKSAGLKQCSISVINL